jgi:hypothetical protein
MRAGLSECRTGELGLLLGVELVEELVAFSEILGRGLELVWWVRASERAARVSACELLHDTRT